MIVAREKTQYYSLPELPGEKKQSRKRPAKRALVKKEKLALTGLVVLFFCSSLLIAFYYAQVMATGYMLNSAESELVQLRKESDDLYTKVNQFSSLENMETLAVGRLGMVKPQNDQVILVQSVMPLEQQAGSNATATAVAVGAGADQDIGRTAGEKHEQNWVIRAFTKMVGQLEASIHAG